MADRPRQDADRPDPSAPPGGRAAGARDDVRSAEARELAGCLRGDADAWRAFHDRFDRMIRAIVRRVGVGGDDELVDDMVQETLLRLARHDARLLRTYDPRKARLSTFVGLVARSVTIDHLRRRRLDAAPLEAAAEAAGDDRGPAARVGPVPDLPEIPRHVLSPRQQLVIRLLFDEDRPVPEAAAILGVDEQTIRSAKHKALVKLRSAMAEAAAREDDAGGADAAAPALAGDGPARGRGRGPGRGAGARGTPPDAE